MKDLTQQITKGNKMKDFLKDVPKLEDLPKALIKGVEHYILSGDGYNYAVVNRKTTYISWVPKAKVSPIPELTHWEASDFHKWFAENGMKYAQIETIRGYFNIASIRVDSSFSTHSNTIISFADVISIRKNVHTESTTCAKPIKTGM